MTISPHSSEQTALTIHEQLSFAVCRMLVTIQQQHPDWLSENYRKFPFQQKFFESTQKLSTIFKRSTTQNTLLTELHQWLHRLLLSPFFESALFVNFMAQVHVIFASNNSFNILIPEPPTPAPTNEVKVQQPVSESISILLLDAENMHLDQKTEIFLGTICQYPIQIKIAFANWRNASLGKRDQDLYQRKYQLIHVPAGKNSADFKMTAFGASIRTQYPNAKEVFVCSSDSDLSHLCNLLPSHGITVYSVCQNKDIITVTNSTTSKTINHSLKPKPEIPSLDKTIAWLQSFIKAEYNKTKIQTVELNNLAQQFRAKHNVSLREVIITHSIQKSPKAFLTEHPKFQVIEVDDPAKSLVTLTELQTIATVSAFEENIATEPVKNFTKASLEKALLELLKELLTKYPDNHVPIGALGAYFRKQHGQPIKSILSNLGLGKSFPKFLQSCNSFRLRADKNDWQVAIAALQEPEETPPVA